MATPLERLERELARLDALLAQNPSWRALQEIDVRLARGERPEDGSHALRAKLEADLAHTPAFADRVRIAVEIQHVRAEAAAGPAVAPERAARVPSLSARIAMIEPRAPREVFRTRVNIKPAIPAAETPALASSPCAMPPIEALPTPAARPDPAPAVTPADLTCIRGIDAATAVRLAGLGIVRFDQIAGWSAADVARVEGDLGVRRRIAREGWIEQAAILAAGRSTAFASGGARVEIALPPADVGAAGVRARSADMAKHAASAAVAKARATGGAAASDAPPAADPPAPPRADPLRREAPEVSKVPTQASAPATDPGARTRALFERGRWLDSIRSLESAVLAAEAATSHQHDNAGRLSEPARGLPGSPALPRQPDSVPQAALASPLSGPPGEPPRRLELLAPAPIAPSASAHVEPPPPPTPYREPVTEFGRSPHTEANLDEIVSDLRKSLSASASVGREERGRPPASPGSSILGRHDDRTADLPGIHSEEASVVIRPRVQGDPPAKPDCEAPLRPLPVRVRPPPGEGQRVELHEGEAHEAYRGMPMEASVEIVQFDEEGRRIPKASK